MLYEFLLVRVVEVQQGATELLSDPSEMMPIEHIHPLGLSLPHEDILGVF